MPLILVDLLKKKKTDYNSRSIEIKATCLVLLT